MHYKVFISYEACFIHLANVALSDLKCWWILVLFPALDNFRYLTICVKCNCSTHFTFHSGSDIIWINDLFASWTKISMMNDVENLKENEKYEFFAIFSSFGCHGNQGSYLKIKEKSEINRDRMFCTYVCEINCNV